MLVWFYLANYVLPISLVAFAAAYCLKRHRRHLFPLLGSVAVSLLVGRLIKAFFYLPRPFLSDGRLPPAAISLDGSFPSNHTAGVFAAAFYLWSLDKKIGWYLLVLSLFVAAARIAFNFHSIPDVIGGLFLGWVSAILIRRVFGR